MSQHVREEAKKALKEIKKVTAVTLAEPAAELVPLRGKGAPAAADVKSAMAEIDMTDTGSIVRFGSSAQAELQEISQAMLADVRNKDVGPAGDSLRSMVTTIRGFSVSELDMRSERSWWEKLLGRMAPAAKFVARFETVQGQIDKVTDNLRAGEKKIKELDDKTIPAKAAKLEAAPENKQVIMAQELRDLRAARDDLERRVHDLKLTRQVTMQSLPSIRLVQENDKSLVTKINSTLVNTVPLWETQLAQAVTIQRSSEAAGAVKDANDLTNELLTANAKNLREANRVVRQEMERGVFDIEAIKAANAELVATIEESLAIADEGKKNRAAAEGELKTLEGKLRDTLAAAKATGNAAGTSVKS